MTVARVLAALLITIAALTLALSLALTPSAQASERAMTWEFATLVAADYWSERGITVPCQPTPRVLTEAENAALQTGYGSEIAMAVDLAKCSVLITPGIEWFRTHGGGADYCQGVVHEYGHFLGLERFVTEDRDGDGRLSDHDYGGVMDANPYVWPFGCTHPRQWAVRKGWRKPPRWVQRSPARVGRLWLAGRVWQAQVVRARWLRSSR